VTAGRPLAYRVPLPAPQRDDHKICHMVVVGEPDDDKVPDLNVAEGDGRVLEGRVNSVTPVFRSDKSTRALSDTLRKVWLWESESLPLEEARCGDFHPVFEVA